MKRFNKTEVLQKANLYYTDENNADYCVGTISKEFVFDKMVVGYIFDIDKATVDKLRLDPCFIPGLDLDDYGYYQAFSRLPYFISMRIADPRRSDIGYFLDLYEMSKYDAFTLFLRSEGRYTDRLHVKEIDLKTGKELNRSYTPKMTLPEYWEWQEKELVRTKQKRSSQKKPKQE